MDQVNFKLQLLAKMHLAVCTIRKCWRMQFLSTHTSYGTSQEAYKAPSGPSFKAQGTRSSPRSCGCLSQSKQITLAPHARRLAQSSLRAMQTCALTETDLARRKHCEYEGKQVESSVAHSAFSNVGTIEFTRHSSTWSHNSNNF